MLSSDGSGSDYENASMLVLVLSVVSAGLQTWIHAAQSVDASLLLLV